MIQTVSTGSRQDTSGHPTAGLQKIQIMPSTCVKGLCKTKYVLCKRLTYSCGFVNYLRDGTKQIVLSGLQLKDIPKVQDSGFTETKASCRFIF